MAIRILNLSDRVVALIEPGKTRFELTEINPLLKPGLDSLSETQIPGALSRVIDGRKLDSTITTSMVTMGNLDESRMAHTFHGVSLPMKVVNPMSEVLFLRPYPARLPAESQLFVVTFGSVVFNLTRQSMVIDHDPGLKFMDLPGQDPVPVQTRPRRYYLRHLTDNDEPDWERLQAALSVGANVQGRVTVLVMDRAKVADYRLAQTLIVAFFSKLQELEGFPRDINALQEWF